MYNQQTESRLLGGGLVAALQTFGKWNYIKFQFSNNCPYTINNYSTVN